MKHPLLLIRTIVLSAGLMLMINAPALAEVQFEMAFQKLIQDKSLDREEYRFLIKQAQTLTQPEDLHFANHLFSMLTQYQSLVYLSFHYTYQQQKKRVEFLFSPSHSENELIKAQSKSELLGKISQQDLLSETTGDGFRCGAASLLAGHYLLYGNFTRAFQQLQLKPELTYRQIHWAQEKLYRLANQDGEDGLTQRLVYQVHESGKVKIIKHEGEIELAAKKIGLSIVPLKITVREDLLDRQKVILDLWRRNPEIPLLVGVYLDSETGEIFPPDEITRVQNHFVLVFRDSPQVWMYNSGVTDNGRQQAIQQLNAQDLRDFVMKTRGSVNALFRN